MITELFYSHILNINRGSLHTRSFRRIHFSVSTYRWALKMVLRAWKVSRTFKKRVPGLYWMCTSVTCIILNMYMSSIKHAFLLHLSDCLLLSKFYWAQGLLSTFLQVNVAAVSWVLSLYKTSRAFSGVNCTQSVSVSMHPVSTFLLTCALLLLFHLFIRQT